MQYTHLVQLSTSIDYVIHYFLSLILSHGGLFLHKGLKTRITAFHYCNQLSHTKVHFFFDKIMFNNIGKFFLALFFNNFFDNFFNLIHLFLVYITLILSAEILIAWFCSPTIINNCIATTTTYNNFICFYNEASYFTIVLLFLILR